jgi:predicted transcriptional regulator
MKRSKLEMYVDIIQILAQKGPLKLSHVMYKANLNCVVLKESLGFLIRQGLVEEKTLGRRRNPKTVFLATARGVSAVRYFRELRQILPLVE